MTCEDYAELLSAAIDQELTNFERLALQEHLEGCSRCSQRLESMRREHTALLRAELPQPPGLAAKIRKAIECEYRGLKRMGELPAYAGQRGGARPGEEAESVRNLATAFWGRV